MSPKKKERPLKAAAAKRRISAFGPGTAAALIIAATIVASRGRSAGGPQVLDRLPNASQRLWKPEPQLLLSQSLGLTTNQEARIKQIAADWQRSKEALLKEMASYQPKRGSLGQIRGGLAGYSQLSEVYDATRSKCWNEAIQTLNPTQTRRAEAEGSISGGAR